jgi:hypothetical protein
LVQARVELPVNRLATTSRSGALLASNALAAASPLHSIVEMTTILEISRDALASAIGGTFKPAPAPVLTIDRDAGALTRTRDFPKANPAPLGARDLPEADSGPLGTPVFMRRSCIPERDGRCY